MPKILNETEYQAIKKTLINANITSANQLETKIKGMNQSAIKWSVIGTLSTIPLLLVLAKYAVFIVLIYLIYMAWMWSSTLASSHYFKRYLEEINEAKEAD